ncbi:melanoma-associated antigen E1 [Ochotona princeps]|uniref:melanoma-associated antigen E1 n=1 Tax=Ochotona princeps TaxID=9978 RepID=UPI002714B288|nr:melanoma-associated antigen E1 [Ochotona princeps]
MSLVSQNSRRRRRSAKATALNGSGRGEIQAPNAPELPPAMPGPDDPQGLCDSEGSSTSEPPTPGDGFIACVPPPASAGSSSSPQPTVSAGSNTCVQPTPGEGPSASGSPVTSEGRHSSVPLTGPEGCSACAPPGPSEGQSTCVQPADSEGSISAPPSPAKGPRARAPPTASEGSSRSVPPPASEGPSAAGPPTLAEDPSTSRQPSASEGLGASVPAIPGGGRSRSVPPTPAEGSNRWVQPTTSKGRGASVLATSDKGRSTTSGQPSASEGFNVPPTHGGGPSRSVQPTTSKAHSASVLPDPGEGPSTSGQLRASKGCGTSMLPDPGEGPSTSRLPMASEEPAALLSPSASVGRNLCKCSIAVPNRKVVRASADYEGPKGAAGPMEFQVLRDCESSNCITIMGLGTSPVVLTLKPQDPMEQNVAELLQFLLVKDQSKYPIRESEMREYIDKEYRSQFSEILKRAAAHLECIFRFELKELDPEQRTYILLNKLGPVPFEGLEEIPNGPKMGLLMMILGQIFLNGNQAREAEIWEMLWRMGVQRERRLSVFGNPKRLLSIEFVWQRYLDYRPITNHEQVEYEFFWGPRSHLETSKMKILKFMARIYNKDPMDWPEQYNEALEEEAIRAAAEEWQAFPQFRRPYFEEIPAEVPNPDLDVSAYPSKYPPHSWPESRMESKSRKLVQLFLLMDSTKLPIPKKGILYYIGRECSKVFPDLLNRAARTLNHVYGTELVVLDPRNHSYTLYNRREMEDTEEIVDSPNRPGNNFLMQVLSFIFIMGNHAKESAVWAFLRGLGVQSGRKHVITCRYLSQRYIDSLRVPDSDPVQYEFVWGPRARLETSKMKALRYVARIHRKEPQDWPQQYREAIEDEANRADAGRRQFFVHNFR